MDEFRKPYEYEEERISGFLLVFVIMLYSVDLFLALTLVVQGYDAARQIPMAGIAFLIFGILYMLFLLFTAISCYKVKKNMIAVSKVFLVIRAVFTLFSLTIIYLDSLGDKSLIGTGEMQYENVNELSLIIFVLPAAYMVVFSIGWFLYFMNSKKCAELIKARSRGAVQ